MPQSVNMSTCVTHSHALHVRKTPNAHKHTPRCPLTTTHGTCHSRCPAGKAIRGNWVGFCSCGPCQLCSTTSNSPFSFLSFCCTGGLLAGCSLQCGFPSRSCSRCVHSQPLCVCVGGGGVCVCGWRGLCNPPSSTCHRVDKRPAASI